MNLTDDDLLQFMYQAPVGLFQTTLDGQVQFATPLASQLLLPLSPGGDLDNLFDVLSRTAPELRNIVGAFKRKRGRIVSEYRFPVLDASGVVDRMLAVTIVKVSKDRLAISISDITDLIKSQNEAEKNRQILDAVSTVAADVDYCALDRNGQIETWSESGERLTGFNAADVIGKSFGVLVVDADDRRRVGGSLLSDENGPGRGDDTVDWDALLKRAASVGTARVEGPRQRKNGEVFWAETLLTKLTDIDGEAAGFTVVTREVGEERARQRALVNLASTDGLTGVLNRRAFFELAQARIEALRGRDAPYAVAIADLDHFKRLNDAHGHAAGDDALRAFAGLLRERAGGSDIVARIGGEEFVVFFSDHTLETAIEWAEALRAATAALAIETLDGTPVQFTVTIGVSEPAGDDEPLAETIARADASLYAGKANGRDCVVPPTSIRRRA